MSIFVLFSTALCTACAWLWPACCAVAVLAARVQCELFALIGRFLAGLPCQEVPSLWRVNAVVVGMNDTGKPKYNTAQKCDCYFK